MLREPQDLALTLPASIKLLRVDPLSSLGSSCLEILRASIPPAEQLGEKRLRTLLGRDDYRMYALVEGANPVATSILYLPRSELFAFLDYMAVRSELRGRGLGSLLFRELVTIASTEKPDAGYLIFEVDDERKDSAGRYSVNRRRIEFYRRLGARMLSNVEYLFPSPDGPGVPMRLMVYRLQAKNELSQQNLRAALENLFQEIHGRKKDDSLLRLIVDNLPCHLVLE